MFKRFIVAVSIFLTLVGCSLKSSEPLHYKIVQQNLKLKIDPSENVFQAIDTLSISYFDQANEIHFCLNKNLSIKNISVGNQALDFSEKDLPPNFDNDGLKFYVINLPLSLQPQKIEIQYEGALCDSLVTSFSQKDTVEFCQAWHPIFYDSSFDFKVWALTSSQFKLFAHANQVDHVVDHEFHAYVWESIEPQTHIKLFATNAN